MTQFYLTVPQICPYLPHQFERKLFAHLEGDNAVAIHDMLTHGGFRRSQNIAYKPSCESCNSCVSTRVVAQEFQRSKNMQRIWRKNSNLKVQVMRASASLEQYALFKQYVTSRHGDGGMVHMSLADYTAMIEETHVNTLVIEYRLFNTATQAHDLIAVALSDDMMDGLSMVYSFFDPSLEARSLGTFLILDHIERVRNVQKLYVYLGYWIEGSVKMRYKTRFIPQEHLGLTGWSIYEVPPYKKLRI
jgi:leucyl-tRNA---protein transferase